MTPARFLMVTIILVLMRKVLRVYMVCISWSVGPVRYVHTPVWRAKCNKIRMKIRHTYVRIYGHDECAYTDLCLVKCAYADLCLHMRT